MVDLESDFFVVKLAEFGIDIQQVCTLHCAITQVSLLCSRGPRPLALATPQHRCRHCISRWSFISLQGVFTLVLGLLFIIWLAVSLGKGKQEKKLLNELSTAREAAAKV